MKITGVMVAAILAVAGAPAMETRGGAHRSAIVCVEGTGGDDMAWYARGMVSKMFSAIDVSIDWRLGLKDCPAGAVRITLSHTVPPHVHAKALAYAMPYEGSHIAILRPRFNADASLTQARALMAHVMAHEIGHILQGHAGHSESGVMKAKWNQSDWARMASNPLPFTEVDILLIHNGLAARAASIDRSTRAGQ